MSKQTNPWADLEGTNIPTTIELDPVIYEYTFPGWSL
jgi:hypothetical protein